MIAPLVASKRILVCAGPGGVGKTTTTLTGSQEYAATLALHELARSDAYDLIVLDTPPTAHALDFLEAPRRILDFLGNETARALLAPAGRPGLKLVQLGGTYVAKTPARFTGAGGLPG